jgi:hypothetical protein
MNSPRWRMNRPIMDHMQGVIDFLAMLLRIVIYIFVLCLMVRLLWFCLVKIF